MTATGTAAPLGVAVPILSIRRPSLDDARRSIDYRPGRQGSDRPGGRAKAAGSGLPDRPAS